MIFFSSMNLKIISFFWGGGGRRGERGWSGVRECFYNESESKKKYMFFFSFFFGRGGGGRGRGWLE